VKRSLLLPLTQLLFQEYWSLTLLLFQIILLNRLLALSKNHSIMVLLVSNVVVLQIYSILHLRLALLAQTSTDSILHLINVIRNLQQFQTQILCKDYLLEILLYSLKIHQNKLPALLISHSTMVQHVFNAMLQNICLIWLQRPVQPAQCYSNWIKQVINVYQLNMNTWPLKTQHDWLMLDSQLPIGIMSIAKY